MEPKNVLKPFKELFKSKTNKPQKKYRRSLHCSLKNILILAQIFGFLPVQGITGSNFRSLHFKWKSFRVFYSFMFFLGALFLSGTQFHKLFVKGTDLIEIDRFFFNFAGVLSIALFAKLAHNWPQFVKDWSLVEISMISYNYPNGLNKKLNCLIRIFMTLALIEHILVQSNKLVLAIECHNTTEEAFTYFLSNMSFSHIFSITQYNIFKGLTMQLINLQLTFSWTWTDLFIMLISTALAYRFKQISIRLQLIADSKIEKEKVWKYLREDYNRLCELCRRVNREISFIVLLSFTGNLFFILVQLFHTLKPMRNNLERIYFSTSFSLLIGRTVCVCLYGAQVNDESTKPLVILNSVPSHVYNIEIQRFIQQIGSSQVAITGRNFFNITRGLILSIAGAIVTYELVLIQFNGSIVRHKVEEKGICPIFV